MLAPLPQLDTIRIAVIGLGYVGLPLLIAFSKRYNAIGFDINPTRIESLQKGIDETKQVSKEEILRSHCTFVIL